MTATCEKGADRTMKKLTKHLLRCLLLLLLALLLALPIASQAGWGDFGGDSDFGDSDWDFDWGSDWDFDWGSNSNHNRNNDRNTNKRTSTPVPLPQATPVILQVMSQEEIEDSLEASADRTIRNAVDSLAVFLDPDYTLPPTPTPSPEPTAYVRPSSPSRTSSSVPNANTLSLIGFVIVSILLVPSILRRRSGGKGAASAGAAKRQPAGASPTSGAQMNTMNNFCAQNPDFDEAAFCSELSTLYQSMQRCWTARDITPLQSALSPQYYAQTQAQIQSKIDNHQTNYVENVKVVNVTPRGWIHKADGDHLIVEFQGSFVEYTLHDKTGELLAGSRTLVRLLTYEWDVRRTPGMTGHVGQAQNNVTCPSCASVTSINETGRCHHCGRVLHADKFNWEICGMKGISQRTLR